MKIADKVNIRQLNRNINKDIESFTSTKGSRILQGKKEGKSGTIPPIYETYIG